MIRIVENYLLDEMNFIILIATKDLIASITGNHRGDQRVNVKKQNAKEISRVGMIVD